MKVLGWMLVSVFTLITIIAIVSNHLVLATIYMIVAFMSMMSLLLGDEED